MYLISQNISKKME